MNMLQRFAPSFLLLIVLVAIWELFCRASNISPTILPAPSAVFFALINSAPILLTHTAQTLTETLIGVAIAVALGACVALILFASPKVRAAIYPLLVLSQTIPMIALAPLLLIWFGFDLTPKVIIVVLYCFFPIAVALSDALFNVDQGAVDLVVGMRASKWQIMRYVRLPAALPAFFSGLRISMTYAIAGAIVGEYVGAYRGLGVFMQTSANSHATALVFAALFVTAFLTMALLGCVYVAERIFVPWKQYE